LTLRGMWEEASKGVIFRQEVLWDAFVVSGTEIANGSFEDEEESGVPAGWQSFGGRTLAATAELPAADGKRLARTWHDQGLSTSLTVKAGEPVDIICSVRAAVPPGFVEMPRIESRDTPAHRAAKRFRRGANFGNYLEAPKGQDWGAKYAAEDFEHVRAEGFDHVRLPIAWQHYASGSNFRLSSEIFAKVDALVNEAVKNKLGVIVNIHHYDAFTSNPADNRENFLKLWRQIAEHYAEQPDLVAFELLNEPKDAATTDVLNPIFADAIKLIRQSCPKRTIFVGPGKWNSVFELSNLRLPNDDHNLIVTVHCYEPFYFTHQGASWSGSDTKITGIRFPGPPEKPLEIDPSLKVNSWVADWIKRYNTLPTDRNPSSPAAFRSHVAEAAEWSAYYGRPIHFGEFGCYERADAESRAAFYRAFREALDKADLGWAAWDWKAGFRYWDDKTGRPVPGMREALFPKSR
ncbi:MAG TPA: glycoside hydrolase family 5 protein, partial [Planctomycetaceae bacterium]|nr:glycoside hydrolase family 5 protein [Planctomycetaceae bacterium]